LDIAKHASAELRSKNPNLHQELVKAVNGGATVPQAQARGPNVGDASEITRRKALWREKCEQDSVVAYRDSVITEVQRQQGTKVAVDEVVCDMPNVDLKRYLQGKKKRELLLAESGLAREGVDLVLLPGWTDSSCQDSMNGDGQSDEGKDDFVTRADFASMQAILQSLATTVGQLVGKDLPPKLDKPVKAPAAPPGGNTKQGSNTESKGQGDP